MKKLNLDVSALEVESFQTSWLSSWAGTVHGQNDATAGGNTKCGGIHTCGQGCLLSEGPVTHCGGVQTCGDGCPRPVSEGPVTQCGGVQTCGDGCPRPVSEGPVTQCGGVQTCGAGCNA